MSTNAAPAFETPAMSGFARLAGVLIDPKPAFADIASRPRWLTPLLLVMAMSMVYLYLFSGRVGWEPVMRQTMESSSRMQNIPAEQRERIIAQQVKFASVGAYAGVAVGVPIYTLVIAGVLLFIFKTMMGAALTFKQVFAITAHASLTGLVGGAVGIAVLFLKRPEDFNFQNPAGFNIGAYLDPQAHSKWLVSAATSIDLFSIWTVLLLATGVSVAARRLPFARAVAGVALPWVIWIVLKSGWAAMFS